MNGSRSSPPRQHGDRSSLDALSRTIEGLEARIEGLVSGPGGRDPRRAPEQDDRRGARAPQQNALDEIRQRQRMLDSGHDHNHRERNERLDERRPARDYRAEAPEPRRAWQQAAPVREPASAQREPAHRDNAQDIAQTLLTLRNELKQDIRDGISREVGGLLSEMRSIKSLAGNDRHAAEDIRGDLARLAEGIGQIGRQARPDEADSLRAEFEDLKAMMDNLAREDSIRRMESRWHGVEERLQGFNTNGLQDELVSLAYRLDDIKSQLGSMSQSPAIRSLEDRMLTIATSLDEIGKRIVPNDRAVVEQISGLDRRLDDISRAIDATQRNAGPSVDPVFLQRLESRIGALASQIDQIGAVANRPDPAFALGDRLEALAERIEDLASERSAARLEERLDALSALVENRQASAAQSPDLTHALYDISRKIDALDHGTVNDTLGERLDRLARRIDEIDFQPQAVPLIDDSALRRLENQIGGIAARLEETASAPATDDRALANLEAQIANLSHLISQPGMGGGMAAGLAPEFENRMAAIEDYIATSDEYIIEAARQAAEAVLDGFLRNGGATAHGAGPAPDLSALTDLANDLRQLEDLTRNSEERTHRTFEALHDTLIQIAGRLEHLDRRTAAPEPVEQRPEPRRVPQAAEPAMFASAAPARASAPVFNEEGSGFFDEPPARTETVRLPAGPVDPSYPTIRDPELDAAPEAVASAVAAAVAVPAPTLKKSLLGSLTQRFLPKKKDESALVAENAVRALVEPTPPIAPEDSVAGDVSDELLEPGSGVPDVKKILARVRASQQGKGTAAVSDAERADYIAAARRAAQVAARELSPAETGGKTARGRKAKAETPAPAKDAAASGSLIARYRRPLLLAVGAVLLVVMAVPQLNKLIGGNGQQPDEMVAQQAIEQSAPAQVPDAGMTLSAPQQAGLLPNDGASDMPAEELSTENSPADFTAAPSAPVETVPLAPASASERPTDTASLDQGQPVPAAATVPAEIQPASLADAAREGDPVALFEIGSRYTNGTNGLAVNLAEAAKWYQQAADKAFAPAQYRIANLYEKGTGITQDSAKAMDYYRKAAEQGNASAMHNLAVMYASGTSGTPDLEAAAKWFTKAADLGVSDSQFNLAILYARGNGVARDLEESYKWFAVAAKGGDKDAAQKRDEVANALRPEQLSSARAKAELWNQQPLDSKSNEVTVPDEWAGKGLKTATVDMKKAIRNIQAILNNNGFDAGVPDGEMGKKTVTAIKAFQKSVGQEPTGKINDELVKELLARNK